MKQDNHAEAENEARKALKLDRNYEPVTSLLSSIKEKYYKRGLTALEQNEWQSAKKFAEEALRIDPKYQQASDLLVQTNYQQGIDHIKNSRYKEGINILLSEISHPRNWLKLGRTKVQRLARWIDEFLS